MKNHRQVGFTDLLFLVFLHLKLTHAINWSWWWIFMPLIMACVMAIIVAIAELP